jgi:hypothetical protein
METSPTVFESSPQAVLGLPVLVGVVCFLVVASMAIHGLLQDTSTQILTAVCAVETVACVVWALAWRRRPPARLTISDDAIVFHGAGVHGKQQTSPQRPDSRLRVELRMVIGGTITRYVRVIFDELDPSTRITIDVFGDNGVKAACKEHGWVRLDPAKS